MRIFLFCICGLLCIAKNEKKRVVKNDAMRYNVRCIEENIMPNPKGRLN